MSTPAKSDGLMPKVAATTTGSEAPGAGVVAPPASNGGSALKNGAGKARALMETLKAQFAPVDPHQPASIKFALIVRRGASRAQIPRMAAALSYRTIFGLIPMIVVSLVVLAAFAKPEDVTQSVRQLMRFAGLSEIVIDEKAANPDDEYKELFDQKAPAPNAPSRASESPPIPAAPVGATDAAEGAESFANLAGTKEAVKLDKWIEGLVLRVQSIRLDALGAVGLVMLIYAAISMMVEIEKAFNHIFMAPSGRSWTRRVPLYWTMLTLGSICMAGTFAMQEIVRAFVDKNLGDQGFIGSTAAMVVVYAITVVITTLLLLVMYTTVPNTRVKLGSAAVGAVLSAIAWEAAKWGFAEYVRFSAGTSRLYGMIALLPLFLLWVYLTWCIVLTGLQIAHSLQTYGVVRERGSSHSLLASLGLLDERASARVTGIVDPGAILPVMLAIAERFDQGKSTDHPAAAQLTGVDERVVSEMLERLAGAGLLHRVQGERDGMFALSRPPELIRASDVLRVGEDLVALARGPSSKVMHEIARSRVEAFGGKSLADLLRPKPGAVATS